MDGKDHHHEQYSPHSGQVRGPRHNASSLAGLFLIFIAAITYGSYFYGVPGSVPSIQSQAELILHDNPLIDGHNDLLILLREFYKNKKYISTDLRPKKTRAIRRRLSKASLSSSCRREITDCWVARKISCHIKAKEEEPEAVPSFSNSGV